MIPQFSIESSAITRINSITANSLQIGKKIISTNLVTRYFGKLFLKCSVWYLIIIMFIAKCYKHLLKKIIIKKKNNGKEKKKLSLRACLILTMMSHIKPQNAGNDSLDGSVLILPIIGYIFNHDMTTIILWDCMA